MVCMVLMGLPNNKDIVKWTVGTQDFPQSDSGWL